MMPPNTKYQGKCSNNIFMKYVDSHGGICGINCLFLNCITMCKHITHIGEKDVHPGIRVNV